MTLIKRGSVAKKRRKNILKFAKGFRGSQSKLFRTANQKVMKAFKNAYVGRKNRKRNFRSLWIRRINGESRLSDISYNKLVYLFKKQKILLNKKILSNIITNDSITFTRLINNIK